MGARCVHGEEQQEGGNSSLGPIVVERQPRTDISGCPTVPSSSPNRQFDIDSWTSKYVLKPGPQDVACFTETNVREEPFEDMPGFVDFKYVGSGTASETPSAEMIRPSTRIRVNALKRRYPLRRIGGRWKRDGSPDGSPYVTLHIYELGNSKTIVTLNKILRPIGSGAFHCGVEVYGREWSYSDAECGEGTGVFYSKPRNCPDHTYFESVKIGKTANPESAVIELVHLMAQDWLVKKYDTLTFNCCHFCSEFCQRLGVGDIPPRVLNLAGAGAAIASAYDPQCCRQIGGDFADQFCCDNDGPDGLVTVTTCSVQEYVENVRL